MNENGEREENGEEWNVSHKKAIGVSTQNSDSSGRKDARNSDSSSWKDIAEELPCSSHVSVRRVILKRFIAGFFPTPFPPPRYRCSLAVQRVPLRVPFGKLLRPVSAFTSARLSGELLRFSGKPLRSLPFR
ncbi:hypothetical protein NDU88_002566 [Pleurodeles waltl]|uniref:Uncharacterized protein n=1 Tax=Pleurodeles waltl TaxID=8319 RepID=A0AAV7RBD0_PLEWA|nr:hypothetical protein NDU88_002566 [Pleurodeles waltl]